jgi:Cys-rich four helix bundle protein (predicted Tat secretion target)
MTRKQLIASAAATAVALKTGSLLAQAPVSPGPHGALADAASNCIGDGERCLQHCLELLGSGDKSMDACAKTVRDMLVTCEAMRTLANAKSPILKKMAAVCLEACKICAEACDKHPRHAICKRCGDSCRKCMDEIKKIA